MEGQSNSCWPKLIKIEFELIEPVKNQLLCAEQFRSNAMKCIRKYGVNCITLLTRRKR